MQSRQAPVACVLAALPPLHSSHLGCHAADWGCPAAADRSTWRGMSPPCSTGSRPRSTERRIREIGRKADRARVRLKPGGAQIVRQPRPLRSRCRQRASTASFNSRSATCCRGWQCAVASESTKAPVPAKEMGASVSTLPLPLTWTRTAFHCLEIPSFQGFGKIAVRKNRQWWP
jgi:hypothetical protein